MSYLRSQQHRWLRGLHFELKLLPTQLLCVLQMCQSNRLSHLAATWACHLQHNDVNDKIITIEITQEKGYFIWEILLVDPVKYHVKIFVIGNVIQNYMCAMHSLK